jgi:hypothetical protein
MSESGDFLSMDFASDEPMFVLRKVLSEEGSFPSTRAVTATRASVVEANLSKAMREGLTVFAWRVRVFVPRG